MENDGPASPAASNGTPTFDEPDAPVDDQPLSPPTTDGNIASTEDLSDLPSTNMPKSPDEGPQSPSDMSQSPDDISKSLEDMPQSPDEAPQSPTDTPQSPNEAPLSPTDAPQSPTVDAPPQSPTTETPLSPVADGTTLADTSFERPQSPTDAPLSPDAGDGQRITPPASPSGSHSDSGSVKEDNSKNTDKVTPTKRILSSDSESEDETQTGSGKRKMSSSDNETEQTSPSKKTKRLESDDEEGEGKEKPSEAAGSDKEAGDGDAIADIFGDSSDEEGEFEGFDEAEIKSAAAANEGALPEVSSDDELEDDRPTTNTGVSDFDLMIARKKEERSHARRKKRNVDIINDNDDLIVDMLKKMREAAEEDRNLNVNHQPATKKLSMLSTVMRQLNKSELQVAFMDCGLLSALTEWLAPLPDKSLPHLSVRQSLLKLLATLPHPDTDQLKSSGIGKAIMYLFKHPKELRANRDIAGRLINEWSRPIFGQSSNFKSVNREDLQKRDMQTLKKRRRSSDAGVKDDDEQKALRPGDPGWVYRARVPRPSNRDYVVRPESNVDPDAVMSKGSSKRKKTRYELQKQKMDNKKKSSKALTAVKISIEGRNMAL